MFFGVWNLDGFGVVGFVESVLDWLLVLLLLADFVG